MRRVAKAHPVREAFLACARSHVPLALALLISIAASIVLSLLPPLILGRIVDSLVAGDAAVAALAGLYVACVFGQGIADAAQQAAISVFGQKATHALRSRMAAKLDRLPASYFHEHEAGAVAARIVNDVDAVEALFASGVVGMVVDTCQVAGIICAIFLESPGLAALVLIALPAVVLWTRMIQRATRSARRDARSAIAQESAQIPETLRTLRMVRMLGCQRFMERRYAVAIDKGFEAQSRSNLCDAVYSPLVIAISALVIGVMMSMAGLGGPWADLFGITVGGAVTAMNYVGNVFNPISDIGMELQSIQDAGAAVTRISELLEEPEEVHATVTPADHKAAAVVLDHVSFGYQKEAPVLQDFSLRVETGERVTLVGRTGAGKSTVLSLIMGLYQPDEGSVTVLGQAAGTIAPELRRKSYGYVEQGFRRIPGTIEDEVSLGDMAETRDAAIAALKKVGLWDSVQRLPEGIETLCTSQTFSEGQFQLLGIARAIALDPPLLLLDEVTAHLDATTEARIMAALDAAAEGRTVISVSHRWADAGRGGRLVEIGGPRS